MLRVTLLILVLGLLLTLLSIVSDLLVFYRLRKSSKRVSNWHKYSSWLSAIFMIVAIFIFMFNTQNLISIRWVLLAYLLLSVPKIILLLLWSTSLGIASLIKQKAPQWLFYTYMVMAIGVLGVLLEGAFIARTQLLVKRLTVQSTRLPSSFNHFRVVQISDLHLGHFIGNEDFIRRCVDSINALHPDIIVQTGDLVSYRTSEINTFVPILSKLRATYGVYSILGNHDYGDYVTWDTPAAKQANNAEMFAVQKKMGWILLNNTHLSIVNSNNDSIALLGTENWGHPPFKQYGSLSAAQKGVNPQLFQILLTHNPVLWDAQVLEKTNIDLTLSGHTHASQAKFGTFSPSQFKYKEWDGLYQTTHQQFLYVNPGLGTIMIPIRVWDAKPEITVIDLENKVK